MGSDNNTHVPQDSAERRRLFSCAVKQEIGGRSETLNDDMQSGRYEIIPANAIKENYLKEMEKRRQKKKGDEDDDETTGGKTRVTGDNYQQMYLEEQAHIKEEESQKRAAARLQTLSSYGARETDSRKDSEMRYRAEKLRQDMDWWQNQSGQGLYDDSVINQSLQDIQTQLDAIPDASKDF